MTTSITSNATNSVLQVNGVDSVKFNTGGAERNLESTTCTQTSGALTFTLNPTILSMRSPTLTTGVPTSVLVNAPITLALPSGGTLGFPTTILGRIIQVLLSNGELAIISLSGGVSLSEEGVINTTAISTGSTANNVFYSTTARTGLTYRVVGAVDVVNTAGAWGSPTLVQPMGGNALTAMSSLGYGQTRQNVTASRASGTTYYNTTGKPIEVLVQNSSGGNIAVLVNGNPVTSSGATITGCVTFIVPSNQSYSATFTVASLQFWSELR